MIQRNGGFHLLGDGETHGKDVREDKEELKTEMKLSAARDTMWNGGIRGKQTQINTFDKHTEETVSGEMIERHLINGLQSQQQGYEETHNQYTPLERSPSFKLTKGNKGNKPEQMHVTNPEVSFPASLPAVFRSSVS